MSTSSSPLVRKYKLRCELSGHEDEVNGLCIVGGTQIASSSLDGNIQIWWTDSDDAYTNSRFLYGHAQSVGSLAWMGPTNEYPGGRLVAGGMDRSLYIWNLNNHKRIQALKSHEMEVTCIAVADECIVSSSLDKTLKRWKNGQQIGSWKAHQYPIQALINLPSGELVSGASDGTLKLWKGRKLVLTLKEHTDAVTGLALMPGVGFLSASRDGSIRLWEQPNGEVTLVMLGHSSVVHAVDACASGLVVTGSEDRHAKIWKDGVCIQSIEHPGSVLDVKFLENEDIVTACSDGNVRVWTENSTRIASDAVIRDFDSQLSRCRKKVWGVDFDELPELDSLEIPGAIGEEKTVKEGNSGVTYQWIEESQTWKKKFTTGTTLSFGSREVYKHMLDVETAAKVEAILAISRKVVALEQEEKTIPPEGYVNLETAAMDRKEKLKMELAKLIEAKGRPTEKKKRLVWSKAMENSLAVAVRSLEKGERNPESIHKVLEKTRPDIDIDKNHVVHKLKTWKKDNKELFE